MLNSQNILPGMVNKSIEIFVVENVVKAIHNGKITDIEELPNGIIEIIREEIKKNPEVESALLVMEADSEWKRIKKFLSCRFGGLDYQDDITLDGKFQDGEYWNCPMRGKCAHEGIVCKLPKINDHRLSMEQITLMQLSSTEKTNEVIAEEMNMPMGSYHKEKSLLHKILRVQTKQGITKACVFLNLIYP